MKKNQPDQTAIFFAQHPGFRYFFLAIGSIIFVFTCTFFPYRAYRFVNAWRNWDQVVAQVEHVRCSKSGYCKIYYRHEFDGKIYSSYGSGSSFEGAKIIVQVNPKDPEESFIRALPVYDIVSFALGLVISIFLLAVSIRTKKGLSNPF